MVELHHTVLLKYLKGLVEVIKVLISMERLNEHVVYVDLHGVAELVGKHFIEKSLVGCTSVL